MIRVSLQDMHVSTCSVPKSHGNMSVCMHLCFVCCVRCKQGYSQINRGCKRLVHFTLKKTQAKHKSQANEENIK